MPDPADLKFDPNGYHRHLRAGWPNLQETVRLMAEHGALWSTRGPFRFCPICRRVPESFVGRNDGRAD